MKNERAEKFWDSMYKNFDIQDRPDETIERIQKYLNPQDIVLDFGCATGTVAIGISGKVKEIHGIDFSQKMIEEANRNVFERKAENASFTKATIFDLDSRKRTYDVIIALYVLHLLDDTKEVMRRINELLKPGGLFISETVCIGERKNLLGVLTLILSKTGLIPHVKSFKISDLDKAAIDEHFQIVASKVFYESGIPQLFLVAKKDSLYS